MGWLVYYGVTDKGGASSLEISQRLVSDADALHPFITTFVSRRRRAAIGCAVAAPLGWLVARTDMPLRRTVRRWSRPRS